MLVSLQIYILLKIKYVLTISEQFVTICIFFLINMKRLFSKEEWKNVAGAAVKSKRLKLQASETNEFICPINGCDSNTFKSRRGCRKHVFKKHAWFYYFEEKPNIEDSFPAVVIKRPQKQMRCFTANMPTFTKDCSVALNFINWLCSPGGSGKTIDQANQICAKVLKYAKFCCHDVPPSWVLTKTVMEYCICSVTLIDSFIKYLQNEWKVGKAGVIGYLNSLSHYLDFQRCEGVQPEKYQH